MANLIWTVIVVLFVLWLLGFLAVFSSTEPEWIYAAAKAKPSTRIHRSVWILAWVSVVGGICLLTVGEVFGHFSEVNWQK